MKSSTRKNSGSIIAEAALALPLFFFMIFSFTELARAMYVVNTINIAAQAAAKQIAVNAMASPDYNISTFSSYTNSVRFPISVTSSNQFSYDIRDTNNTSVISMGTASRDTSKKVVVTVTFPAPGDNTYKIPMFDPGNLIGVSVFGAMGLTFSSSATSVLEGSRRTFVN